MNKNLLAVAVASALALTSGIATAEVNWYGKFNMALGTQDYSDDNDDGGLDIMSGGSRLGLRASDKLDNGMTAWVWSEWKMDPSDAAVQFQNRDTLVGLTGGFGTIAAGNAGNPFKGVVSDYDLFGDSTGDISNFGLIEPAGEGIGYSNKVGDVSFAIGSNLYDGEDPADMFATVANLVYSSGPLKVSAAIMNQDDDNNDGDVVHAESAYALGFKYKMDTFGVQALMQSASDVGGAGGGDSDLLELGATFALGAATLKLQYTDFSAPASANDKNLISVGIGTSLSKNTSVGFNLSSGESSSTVDYDAWDLGVSVNF